MKKTGDISISVNYDSAETDAVQLEVDCYGEPILFGVWDVDVRHRGRVLRPEDEWTETCVYHENDCDYLEIDMPLTDNYRLQRFFLLDNKDRILILGDTLLSDDGGRPRRPGRHAELEYESSLLFSPNLIPKPTPEATEWTFFQVNRPGKGSKTAPFFRVLPLTLPEWRSAMPEESEGRLVRGTLKVENESLVLRQQSAGVSMFASLLFDLDPSRMKERYTWRQLSVGENLEPVPDDRAVGYRIQLNREQYLLYHSMTLPANRTLMGHNLIDDLCFARFDPETGVDTLVQVQQELD